MTKTILLCALITLATMTQCDPSDPNPDPVDGGTVEMHQGYLGDYCDNGTLCNSGLSCMDTSNVSNNTVCTYNCQLGSGFDAAECNDGTGLCIASRDDVNTKPYCFPKCDVSGNCDNGVPRIYHTQCFCEHE
jgi:hypothetical protein